MIQCKDCEYYRLEPNGGRAFACDPFTNIKEPECLLKWQLIRLDMLVSAYRAMQQMQQKMAPLQDKIFKYMEREINDIDETEKWKYTNEDDENESSEEDFNK